MKFLTLAGILLAWPVQDPPAAPAPAASRCEFESVEETDGTYECAFTCPWPRGTLLRLEVLRRTTHLSWAPWMEKDSAGSPVEKVNLWVKARNETVHRAQVRLEKDGEFLVRWKPKVPGVYHLQIVYDPGQQGGARDPRFRKEDRSTHRLAALSAGQIREILFEDAKETLRFSDEFFRTLRAAITSSSSDVELEGKMRKLIDEALKRGDTTQHPGTYSLMEHLSPYVLSVPKDPKKDGPNDPRKMSPNKIDVKTANLPPSILRESMVLGCMLMEDAVEEALLLAPQPASKYAGDRRAAVDRLASEIPNACEDLRKLEPSSKLGYVTRTSQFHKLLKEASETVIRMLERRAADPEAAKAILARLRAAAVTIGDPVGSLKE